MHSPKECCFDHERLEVYQGSIAFSAWLSALLEGTVRIGEVKDQLDRAFTSIPLNMDVPTMDSAARQYPQRYRAWAATLARSAFGMRDRLMTSRPDPKDHVPAASGSLLHVRE